jgi:hypothetical protein
MALGLDISGCWWKTWRSSMHADRLAMVELGVVEGKIEVSR